MDSTLIYVIGAGGEAGPIAREVAVGAGLDVLDGRVPPGGGSFVLVEELHGDGAAAEAAFGRVARLAQRNRALFVPVRVIGRTQPGYDPDHPNQITVHGSRQEPCETARAILDHARSLRLAG